MSIKYNQMQIFVRKITLGQYKTYPLIVNRNGLVQEIANKLSAKTGLCSKLIKLSYRSRMLCKNVPILQYHIQSEATINATTRYESDEDDDDGDVVVVQPPRKRRRLNCRYQPDTDQKSDKEDSIPSGHQLKKDLYSINRQISTLKSKSIRRLTSLANEVNHHPSRYLRSRSLCAFSKTWTEIQGDFNCCYKALNAKKLDILQLIHIDNKYEIGLVQKEIKLVENDMVKMDKNIAKIDEKIQTHQRMIDELNVCKARQLSRKEIRKQEVIERRQTLLDFKTTQEDTAADIMSIRKESDNDSFVLLTECFNGIMKTYEQAHGDWDTNDVIQWVQLIENGQFNKKEWVEGIARLKITGDSFKDLRNKSYLIMLGLNAMERKCFFKNIDRVLNKPVDKSNICTVCVQNKIDSAFTPCGHQSVCYQCYQKERRRFTNCPICRKRVTQTFRTFMNGF